MLILIIVAIGIPLTIYDPEIGLQWFLFWIRVATFGAIKSGGGKSFGSGKSGGGGSSSTF